MEMQKIEYVSDLDVDKRIAELLKTASMINIQDDRGGSGSWIVIHSPKPTAWVNREMLEHWGERCSTFDGACIACHAWKHFDETGEIAK